jgi:hypothetical protein
MTLMSSSGISNCCMFFNKQLDLLKTNGFVEYLICDGLWLCKSGQVMSSSSVRWEGWDWWRHEVGHLILAEKWEREKAMWKEPKRERERHLESHEVRERDIDGGFGVVRERMVGCERWRVTGLTSLLSN